MKGAIPLFSEELGQNALFFFWWWGFFLLWFFSFGQLVVVDRTSLFPPSFRRGGTPFTPNLSILYEHFFFFDELLFSLPPTLEVKS